MDFNELNVKELDKYLSDEERKEWNAIYASYRAGSLLTGRVAGMDKTTITVQNSQTGENERREIPCLTVISYRVKILIPESEVWYDGNSARPIHVLHSMIGAEVDYVIIGIDRENNCCIASRKQALQIRRRSFYKLPIRENTKVTIHILAVGTTHLLATCLGFDFTLSQRDLSYGMIRDLRDCFHPGDSVQALFKKFDPEKERITVSVKEAKPHPFDGVEIRHPLNSRRASIISGKYKGGVFCKLEEDLDCLCTYSQYQADTDFKIGDRVIVVITKYDYARKLVYGKIVAKW